MVSITLAMSSVSSTSDAICAVCSSSFSSRASTSFPRPSFSVATCVHRERG